MKRLIPTLATIAFLIYPSISFSSYLIELKNGHQFITYQYWEEDREIRFSLYGGVVGIKKDFVQEIKDSDLPYKEEVAEEKAPPAPDTPETASKEDEDIDAEYYKNAKKGLMEKYSKTKKKLDKAIISRNKRAKREAKKEIKELRDQISALSGELKEANKGVLPSWW